MLVSRTQSIVGSDEKYMMACDWNDNINTDDDGLYMHIRLYLNVKN